MSKSGSGKCLPGPAVPQNLRFELIFLVIELVVVGVVETPRMSTCIIRPYHISKTIYRVLYVQSVRTVLPGNDCCICFLSLVGAALA